MKQIYNKKEYLFKIMIRIPAPCILLVSIYVSSLPVVPVMQALRISDKLIHLVCFAGLCGAWIWWWPARRLAARPVFCVLVTALAVSLYGALDEFHQSFVPGREVSFFDWLADTCGAFIGGAASSVLTARLRGRLFG